MDIEAVLPVDPRIIRNQERYFVERHIAETDTDMQWSIFFLRCRSRRRDLQKSRGNELTAGQEIRKQV